MDELLDWKCPKGHVLGQMRRTGRGQMVLLLYREAVDPKHPGRKPVEVLGELHGSMLGISCSICSKRKTWGKGEMVEKFESVNV